MQMILIFSPGNDYIIKHLTVLLKITTSNISSDYIFKINQNIIQMLNCNSRYFFPKGFYSIFYYLLYGMI